jgi:hypothetical protein
MTMTRIFIVASVAALMTTPAFAGLPVQVPEMDAAAGVAAIALLAGAVALIRERSRRK